MQVMDKGETTSIFCIIVKLSFLSELFVNTNASKTMNVFKK